MHKQMSFQVTGSGKCVGTQGTAEGFLLCMGSYVFPKMAFHGEGLSAKGAFEGFFSRVHYNMVSMTLNSCKRFLDFVHIYEAFIVNAFVLR